MALKTVKQKGGKLPRSQGGSAVRGSKVNTGGVDRKKAAAILAAKVRQAPKEVGGGGLSY